MGLTRGFGWVLFFEGFRGYRAAFKASFSGFLYGFGVPLKGFTRFHKGFGGFWGLEGWLRV